MELLNELPEVVQWFVLACVGMGSAVFAFLKSSVSDAGTQPPTFEQHVMKLVIGIDERVRKIEEGVLPVSDIKNDVESIRDKINEINGKV